MTRRTGWGWGIALVCATPISLVAQTVVVRDGGDRPSAAIIRDAVQRPHVVRAGRGRLELPRDSAITTTLLVIGRPTYLASRVQGDVIVVGADLFLRPGVDITGRAVSIGGSVATTTLGRVAGGTESLRDETYVVSEGEGKGELTLDYRSSRTDVSTPFIQPAGLQGFLMPAYDRVNGLSVPVGVLVTAGQGNVEIEPSVTYRSRLGTLDPAVVLRIRPEQSVRFEGAAGRDTRSNDRWIYSDLLNSAASLFIGLDTRNYFRSTGGEGRLYVRVERPGLMLEPFVGARYEKVEGISAAGKVFSFRGRRDVEKMFRPNPLVESNTIGSALLGAQLHDTSGVVVSRLRAEVEQSFMTRTGTSNFTQLTIDGRVAFPTFNTQRLQVYAHGVATAGDSVPRARYAYLGGSGTLPLLELLETGGTELLFVESRYIIPIERVILPIVGSPSIALRHIMGAAGVRSLPRLEQEIGVELGLSVLRIGVTTDAARKRGTKFGVAVSLAK